MRVKHLNNPKVAGGQDTNKQPPRRVDEVVNLSDRPILAGVVIEGQEQSLKQQLKASAYSTPDPLKVEKATDGWMHQEFPSKLIPYTDVAEIMIRPLTLRTLSLVHASQSQKSFPMLLDALQGCIDCDIRLLTVPDFYFFLYWLRINSYPKSPLTLEWTSKYGNKNLAKVSMASFDITDLKMSKGEFEAWAGRGFCFPTIRDTEVLQDDELPETQKWLAQFAQYVRVDGPVESDYMTKKIEALERMGVDALAVVKEFADKLEHGIVEQITVKDEKFEIGSAIKAMTAEIDNLTRLIEATVKSEDPQAINGITVIAQHIDSRHKEVEELKTAVEEERTVTPDEEVVALGVVDATILFPS